MYPVIQIKDRFIDGCAARQRLVERVKSWLVQRHETFHIINQPIHFSVLIVASINIHGQQSLFPCSHRVAPPATETHQLPCSIWLKSLSANSLSEVRVIKLQNPQAQTADTNGTKAKLPRKIDRNAQIDEILHLRENVGLFTRGLVLTYVGCEAFATENARSRRLEGELNCSIGFEFKRPPIVMEIKLLGNSSLFITSTGRIQRE